MMGATVKSKTGFSQEPLMSVKDEETVALAARSVDA